MKVTSAKRISESCSDNLKSAIQNRKWLGIFAITFTFAFGGVEAQAQQPKKVPRIGYRSSQLVTPPRAEAIRLALRELGYMEGHTIAFAYRYAEGKVDRLPDLAAELVRSKVDIIIAVNFQSVQAAKNATKTIPIVMVNVGRDPVEGGLIESLAHPAAT